MIYIECLAFVTIEENQLCSDFHSKLDIDENDCKQAAKDRWKGFGLQTTSYNPKGCFELGGVWFNRHPVGSRNSMAAPICRRRGES